MPSSTLSSSSLFNVEGYVSVVTGGGTGIGYMIAEGLVRNGATVYITGRREAVLKEAAEHLNGLVGTKGRAVPFVADVTSQEDIERLVDFVTRNAQSVDLLVNNSGISKQEAQTEYKAPLAELQSAFSSSSLELWTETFATNAWGANVVTTAFLNLLGKAAEKGNGRGSVIIVGSINASHWNPNYDLAAYSISKAALEHYAKILAAKLTPYRIRVNVLSPGSFPSEMNPSTNPRALAHPSHNHTIPLGYSGGSEDIVGPVIWLASRAGAYVTGAVIHVDGGLMLIMNGTNKILPT